MRQTVSAEFKSEGERGRQRRGRFLGLILRSEMSRLLGQKIHFEYDTPRFFSATAEVVLSGDEAAMKKSQEIALIHQT